MTSAAAPSSGASTALRPTKASTASQTRLLNDTSAVGLDTRRC